MASPEKGGGGVIEAYKNVNRYIMAGALSMAFLGAFFAPPLIIPALEIAAAEGLNLIGTNLMQGAFAKKS